MRDPERIDRMIGKLRIIWKKNPDWRLGQLISNINYQVQMNTVRNDCFYTEDYVIEGIIDKMNRKSQDE
jgi:hypothetical protein